MNSGFFPASCACSTILGAWRGSWIGSAPARSRIRRAHSAQLSAEESPMQAPSASFVQALSAEEVCPLCLDRYAAADECTCVMCEAPSCPGCAEELDADGAMRCFACRPALSPERSPSQLPVALPRPIQFPVAARVAQ